MLVLCAGTATEIGKTWVGAATLADLRLRGRTVSVRKPAQSYDPDDPAPLDAAILAAATGERPEEVCLPERTYPLPMAPPMAAAALGRPLPLLEDLLGELTWPDPEPEIRWLETVGGPRSPVAVDADAVDLAKALLPDRIVLVADAGLGTINAVQLSVAPFLEIGFKPLVILNRFDLHDDLHRRNAAWLQQKGVPVLLSVEALSEVLRL
jgi:dethiobiotin synthetase